MNVKDSFVLEKAVACDIKLIKTFEFFNTITHETLLLLLILSFYPFQHQL